MSRVEFKIDKIITKERPRMNRKTGAVYTPKKTKDSEREVAERYREKSDICIKDNAIEVEIDIYMKNILSKPDIDNIIKVILDGLNKVAYTDDKNVVKVIATKHESKDEYIVVKLGDI